MSSGGWGRAQRLAGPHDQDFTPLSPTANMDEYMARTYGTGTLDNRPLFGETSARDRMINFAVGGFTSFLVTVTIISSFVFPTPHPKGLNIFFVVCIVMICFSVLVLIFWYRQGDLEPKFRNLIYYTTGSVILLCLCANLYFHDVGRWFFSCQKYTNLHSSIIIPSTYYYEFWKLKTVTHPSAHPRGTQWIC